MESAIGCMEARIKILYIDEEPNNLRAFKAYFRPKLNYEINICDSEKEGLKRIAETKYHIVVLNQSRKERNIIELLEAIGQLDRDILRIVVTAHRDTSLVDKALDEGKIYSYHTKPWNLSEVERAIETAYNVYQMILKKKDV
ncbi:MAG: response regulator [Sporocytophaga sp.]|nr:response regulator [Sporocytophaga sp.]